MKSKTARTLRRLRAATLIAAVAVLGSSWYVYRDVHETVETVQTRTALAMMETAVARSALMEADRLALRSFSSAEARLTGPGDDYQSQIAVASQSLAQVAEHNEGGQAASQNLQLVEGLLVAYTGLIGQADAHHRQSEATEVLSVADLWDASRLLHAQDTGILAYLDQIEAAQQTSLDDQLAGSAITGWRILLVAVPILLLLGLLLWTSWYVRVRFRRSVNVFLAAAFLVSLAFCVLPYLGAVAQNKLETAATDLRQLVNDRRSAPTATGQSALRDLITAQCPTGCEVTLSKLPAAGPAHPAADQPGMQPQTFGSTEAISRAGANSGLEPLVPAGMLLTGLFVALGLHARIEEYRYQPK